MAQKVGQKWISEIDNEAYNGIVLAFYGLEFKFDTEYDVQNYTFYAKIYYPSFFTSVASLFGASREDIEDEAESNGQEKLVYQLFCEYGYDDITCVVGSYNCDGELLYSFTYDRAAYEADLAQEELERQEEQQQIEEQRQLKQEFIDNIKNNAELLDIVLEYTRRILNEIDYRFLHAANDYYTQMTGEHMYETWLIADVTNISYGQLWCADLSEMDKELEKYGVSYTDYIIVHLPCTVIVKAGNRFFDVEYDVAFHVDPTRIKLTTSMTSYTPTVQSMMENTSHLDTTESSDSLESYTDSVPPATTETPPLVNTMEDIPKPIPELVSEPTPIELNSLVGTYNLRSVRAYFIVFEQDGTYYFKDALI